MNKPLIRATLLGALAAFVFGFTTIVHNKPDKDLKYRLTHLEGTYRDEKPYSFGKAFGERIFTFEQGKWTLVFTLGLDPDLKLQVFQFRTYGTYKIEDPSSKVANTYNALFTEERKFVTLKTDDKNLIQAFGFAASGMEKDIEKDISQTGGPAWKPVTQCSSDYDLLSLDANGKLYFGERPADNDMCTPEKRPTKLTPPVTKIK